MEKRLPSYDLRAIKARFAAPDRVAITTTAALDAVCLGFDRKGIIDVIQSIQRNHFYKSMTTYADHAIWQDVYHVPFSGLRLYVKFQADIVTEFRVMSFKEK